MTDILLGVIFSIVLLLHHVVESAFFVMEEKRKGDSALTAIVGSILFGIFYVPLPLVVWWVIPAYVSAHPCIKSHIEHNQGYKFYILMPPVVAPVHISPTTEKVCDQYK